MPRIKPPRPQPELTIPEDHTPPVEPVEIELAADAHGDTEVELAPQPAPKPESKPESVVEDNPLQKALDAQQRAEELQRSNSEKDHQIRERDEQIRRAQERDRERDQEVEQAQYDTVVGHITAQQAVLEAGRRDIRAAKAAGDIDAEIDAIERITDAKSQISQLEIGKQAFETRSEARKVAPTEQRQPVPAPLDFEAKIKAWNVPESAQTWLRKHPEFVNDETMSKRLGGANRYIIDTKGVDAFSPAYYDALDNEFGFKAAPQAEPQPEPQPQRRSIPMSAPVSRDVPSASGQREPSSKMTLSAEERQIARSSFTAQDMTNEQKELLYAQNKRKLQTMKANGSYRLTTEQNG